MANYTVTCRCTRVMRPEPGRPAGYMLCSCGTRVKITDNHANQCQGRGTDGSFCVRDVMMILPVPLCKVHVVKLANSTEFTSLPMHHGKARAWLNEQEHERARHDEKVARARLRRQREEEMRKVVLAEQSTVYYIAVRGYVKIGYTSNMQARMANLLPDAILATEPGARDVEKRRHQQFAHIRGSLGREYFTPHPDLEAHIEAVRAEHGEPTITGHPSYKTWHLGENVLLTVKDAAKLSQVPVRTIYEWLSEERLTSALPEGKKRGTMVNLPEIEQLASLRKAGRLPRFDQAG